MFPNGSVCTTPVFKNRIVRWIRDRDVRIDWRAVPGAVLGDTSRVRSARFRPVYRVFFWLLIAAWLVLAYCGSKPPEGTYVTVARVAAAYYFAHFLILLPMIGVLESPSQMPTSISGTQSARSRAPAPD